MNPLLRVLLVVGGLAAGALAVGARAADEPVPGPKPKVVFDAAGKPMFIGAAGWTEIGRSEKDGRQVVEYRFPQPNAGGKQGVLRVMAHTIARSVKFADLSAEEKGAVESARDAAIQHMMDEVDAMPGLDFVSGGTQFIYTALEGTDRYDYVQYVVVNGIDQPGNKLRPAVAIDFRCRGAIPYGGAGFEEAVVGLEDFCRDALLDINKTD